MMTRGRIERSHRVRTGASRGATWWWLVGIACCACVVAVAGRAFAADAITPADVGEPVIWGAADNVTRLRHLYFSEQPDLAALEAARRAGVVAVVDLRAPDESDWDEEAAVRSLGMAYFNVPLSGKAFDHAAIREIEDIVSDLAGQPTLIHCSSSNRAGGWLATHLVTQHDLAVEEALEAGGNAGITKPVIEASVRRYLGELEAMEQARAALAPLKKNLKRTLTTTMQREGPIAAVDVCQTAAPGIASDAATAHVKVGRTSHRLRNPANAPAEWMVTLLDAMRSVEQQPAPAQVVALGGERFGYVEPIIAQPLCLSCHGENVAPPLLEHIRARYPDDQATGFAEGDLRGMFWAEVTLAP